MFTAVILILGCYSLLCALNQFAYFQSRIAPFNRSGVFPYWSFFAPIPGTSDQRIVYRTQDEAGHGPWVELGLYEARSIRDLFWNPRKHLQKCTSDTIIHMLKGVQQFHASEHEALVLVSWGYIKILETIAAEIEQPVGTKYSFAILTTEGLANRQMKPLFISKWHTL
jgi:hypothetical protein